MKTYIPLFALVITSFFIFGFTQRATSPGLHTEYIDLVQRGEDALVLDGYFKNPTAIQYEYDLFKNNLIYITDKEHHTFANKPISINMTHLVDLYQEMHDCLTKRHFQYNLSAIKIEFGFENNQLVQYFQLLTLKRNGSVNKNGTTRYVPALYGPRYTYTTRGFDPLPPSQTPPPALKNYLENVYINHCIWKWRNKNQKREKIWYHDLKHEGADKWKSDSQAIIFSFQELFSLYHYAYIFPECGESNVYTHDLYLFNGMARFHKYPRDLTSNRNKHTMFFATQSIFEKNEYVGFNKDTRAVSAQTDQAANLAHLSPPNTSALHYTVK